MNLEQRIIALSGLGDFISQFTENKRKEGCDKLNELFYNQVDNAIWAAKNYNGWFDRDSVLIALKEVGQKLTRNSLEIWLKNYQMNGNKNKRILVVLAGNIPLVGFDDVLAVLITGNVFIGKLSSKDDKILPLLLDILVHIEPNFNDKIIITEEFVKDIDAVIATGSNNSARYFEYYFGKYPHIIRKNRSSIAVLDGKETQEELTALGADIFTYYGLGCRNVSKIYVPKNYLFTHFFEAIKHFEKTIDSNKYANNYIYNKSVLEIGREPYLDNGFLILKQHSTMTSAVGMVYYDYYNTIEELEILLTEKAEDIQCTVSNFYKNATTFGNAQQPSLLDYADGVDTLEFVLKL